MISPQANGERTRMSKYKTESKAACPVRKTSIGGQALMEGIMMRGPRLTAMAVRNPRGEIVLEKFPTSSGKRPWPWRVPVIRGIFNFADSMIFGYRCLMRSAEISGLEDAEEEMRREKAERRAAREAAKKGTPLAATGDSNAEAIPPADAAPEDTAPAAQPDAEAAPEQSVAETPAHGKDGGKDKKTSPLMLAVTVVSIVLALALAVGLFIIVPTWLYETLAAHVDWLDADNRYTKSIFTGILKIILLVGYMAAVSLMKDIRRTFRFHGAEHKTIFCYEAGLPLTVENVRIQRRFHPRCGTSFLILMVLVSILVGFFIPPTLYAGNRIVNTLLYSGIRILLVPVIVGLGYELIKFCGRHDNWLTRIIAAPGLALQHITVFEPDDSMIECAIAAVREVIPEDGSDAW